MKKRVLIFPCGSEIALEINRALKDSIHFEMIGASSISDHGEYVFKSYIPNIPFVDDPNFIPTLQHICKENKIDFIFPAHDSVVLKLAEHANEFDAKIITSSLETNEICRSKEKTYKHFKNIIPTPDVYKRDNIPAFPVFLKPSVGQGSKGTHKVSNQYELDFYLSQNNDLMILEYLPGKEYTIDCFTDRHGNLLFAMGRQRIRISNGISVSSKTVNNPKFIELAKKINQTLLFRGVWFFQVKENIHGEFVLMEIAPRIAGTMGLSLGLGINFAQLSLFDMMDYDVSIIQNKYEIQIDRALYASYKTNIEFDTVYTDFDDVISLQTGVNTDVIKLLYQFKNQKKIIILLTKHAGDIYKKLNELCIAKSLFNEIIHIKNTDDKSNYITNTNAIFIDDSFAERQNVSKKKNIPVFGVDNILTLIDWRV